MTKEPSALIAAPEYTSGYWLRPIMATWFPNSSEAEGIGSAAIA